MLEEKKWAGGGKKKTKLLEKINIDGKTMEREEEARLGKGVRENKNRDGGSKNRRKKIRFNN
jgi:hypothetical protein